MKSDVVVLHSNVSIKREGPFAPNQLQFTFGVPTMLNIAQSPSAEPLTAEQTITQAIPHQLTVPTAPVIPRPMDIHPTTAATTPTMLPSELIPLSNVTVIPISASAGGLTTFQVSWTGKDGQQLQMKISAQRLMVVDGQLTTELWDPSSPNSKAYQLTVTHYAVTGEDIHGTGGASIQFFSQEVDPTIELVTSTTLFSPELQPRALYDDQGALSFTFTAPEMPR